MGASDLPSTSTRQSNLLFWVAIAVGAAMIPFLLGRPHLAMWFGFALAARSAIGNDSIQTLGTFIRSNSDVRWYWLALAIGGVLVATFAFGWANNDGDLAYGRLTSIPHPEAFTLRHLAAPLMLLVLTRYGVPLSTTFFLLSMFSDSRGIEKMLLKSFLGYAVALGAGLTVWLLLASYLKRTSRTYNRRIWRAAQWFSTGFLWYSWITHDTANIAVYLPRQASLEQLLIAVGILSGVVILIMRAGGGKIQEVVNRKSRTEDVREATAIDLTYAVILVFLKELSNVPMSTTWVFLGLLAGREMVMGFIQHFDISVRIALGKALRDILLAGVGLGMSLALALIANFWIVLALMGVAVAAAIAVDRYTARSDRPPPIVT